TEILGLGLLIGVKTSLPAAELQARLLKHGVIVGTSDDPHIIRLLPPLTLTQAEVDIFLEAFSSVLEPIPA
ncbi:MAG TPA: aminotransferase class III-fold pyridoxal phosphate-dependent enzyme, partial [Acidobacteriota bacterium]|nr:aminotransferase class III-fold pyridoxal phosphate-dependent enzyme [Acidobacteriota bacterium]